MNDFDGVPTQIESQAEEHIVELPLFDFSSTDHHDLDSWGKGEVEALGVAGSGANNTGFIPRRVTTFPDLIVTTTNYHVDGSNDPSATGAGNMTTLNNYVSRVFTAHENYSVNRVSFRVQAQSSPGSGYTITGGIASYDSSTGYPTQSGNAITFLGSGTVGTTFTNGAYHTITLGSTVSLTAGTKYCVAFQTTVVGTGSISISRLVGGYFSGCIFPAVQNRIGAAAQAKVQGGLNCPMLWGYNNGLYTQWYGAQFTSNDSSTAAFTLNRSPLGSGSLEVGAQIRLDWNVQEVFIRGIAISRARIALGHTLVLKIYGPDAITQIENASASISSDQTGAETNSYRYRLFTFPQRVRLLPYTNYYVMLSATGTATNTNPTRIVTLDMTAEERRNAYDFKMAVVTRGAIDTNLTWYQLHRIGMNLAIDDTYLGNRVGGNN